MYLDVATVQLQATDVKFHGTTCIVAAVTRRYELKRRAERQDETRQRIVDATIRCLVSSWRSARRLSSYRRVTAATIQVVP